MSLIRIEHNPSRRQLLVFSLCWLLFWGIVGLTILHRSGSWPTAATVWAMGAAIAVVGWIFPPLLRIVYLGMAYLAFPIGFVLSYLLLGVIYYAVVTPIGLLMRLAGQDPLQRRFDADAQSYWVSRKPQADVTRYFRQF
jgi:hypothetical protein